MGYSVSGKKIRNYRRQSRQGTEGEKIHRTAKKECKRVEQVCRWSKDEAQAIGCKASLGQSCVGDNRASPKPGWGSLCLHGESVLNPYCAFSSSTILSVIALISLRSPSSRHQDSFKCASSLSGKVSVRRYEKLGEVGRGWYSPQKEREVWVERFGSVRFWKHFK